MAALNESTDPRASLFCNEDHARFFRPKKSNGYDNEEEDDISDPEEEFYYQEVAVDHMSSPPTMSHRDMARPPHEDPEYQKQLRLEATSATVNTETMMASIRERNTAFTISQSPVRSSIESGFHALYYTPIYINVRTTKIDRNDQLVMLDILYVQNGVFLYLFWMILRNVRI